MNYTQEARKIRRIMADNIKKRLSLSKTGKLALTRLPFASTSTFLYTKPQKRSQKKYHIELLMDNSGSMFNSKNRWNSALLALQHIAKILGPSADISITLFNLREESFHWKHIANLSDEQMEQIEEDRRDMVRVPHQYYSDRKIVQEQTKETSSIGSEESDRSGNWEYINIVNAYERISKKKGGKMIIILLDGQMSMDTISPKDRLYIAGKYLPKYQKDTMKRTLDGMKKHGVPVVGIGIQTELSDAYSEKYRYNGNTEQLMPILVKTIKKNLT